jgi:S1-C subfamily serine protease
VGNAQKQHSPTPADVFRQARSSVVLIVGSEGRDKVAQGSGFIVGKDKIVTNYHVIAGLSAAVVLFADGLTEPVTGVVAADADQDAAVLNVRTGTRPPLPLGDELNLHEGDAVLAIGAPQGLELSLTNGIISAFRNSEKKFLIQNTAPIAPGSSGGPLLDSHGRVVGVTTSLLVCCI